MSTRFVHCLTLVGVGTALIAACESNSVSTAPMAPVSGQVTASLVNRFPVPQLFALVDFEHNLSALVGVQANEASTVCSGGFEPYDLSEVLDVHRGTGDQKALIKDGEQLFVIWEGVPVPGALVSCTFQGQTPLATGSLRSVNTDNDIFVGPGPGGNSFHYRATGQLSNPATGQQYHALAKLGGRVAPGSDVIEFDEDVIALTPIGRP